VHLLRRIRQAMAELRADVTAGDDDPELRSQIGERLAYFLLESEIADAPAEALHVAGETVRQTLSDPPTWYQARAMSTYALALLVSGDDAAAREWAERARAAADSDARWVAAEALTTLGSLSSREGDTDAASRMFAAALEQAEGTQMLQVELRATYLLAEQHQARGELAEAARTAQQGELRADSEGLGLAPYGMDLRHLHFQARFLLGEWDQAQRLADGFPVRVTSLPEAVLSAMALFIDVARGNPAVEERRTWLEPFWGDGFVGYVTRSLLAERALWGGDTALAVAHAEAAIYADAWRAAVPSVIRPAAVALAARADRAVAARAVGNADAEAAEIAAAMELLDLAHEGARYAVRPKAVLGPEGRGWLARADAEYHRAAGHNTPEAWEAMLSGFGPHYAYETARGRWRLAEALIEAGRTEEALPIWREAAATATRLGAAPLSAALDALARRARLDPGSVAAVGRAPDSGSAYLTESLTDRERDVLRLLSRGQSNRQIGAELFISPKTASVHVSNILAKLAVTNRTEAAAIAHREGL
jgi:DNA-binding CsgD family transcriptional regulator